MKSALPLVLLGGIVATGCGDKNAGRGDGGPELLDVGVFVDATGPFEAGIPDFGMFDRDSAPQQDAESSVDVSIPDARPDASSADAAFQVDMTPGAELYVETFATAHMSSQSSTVTAGAYTAHPTAIGDRVGNIADPVNGHALEADSAATRPTLVAKSTIGSALQFATGNSERLVLQNASGAHGPVNYVHEVGVGWIALWYQKDGGDGANRVIIDNANWSGANRGHTLACTLADRFQFQVMSPGGGNLAFSYTSGASIPCTVAAGERQLVIVFNGAAGGTFYSCAGSATTLASCSSENFSNLKAFATGAPFDNLTIGATQQGTNPCNCSIANLTYGHYVPTTAQIEAWMATNHGEAFSTSRSLVRSTTTTGCGYNFCMGAWDFTGTAGLYQTTACESGVASNGDPIGCAVPLNDQGTYARHLRRDLIADLNGERPTYQGASGARFDGIDDSLSAISGSASGMRHGIGFSLLLATDSCLDESRGCHLALSGSRHILRTGPSYSQPNIWTVHTAFQTIFSADAPLVGGGGHECLTAYRDGRTWVGQAEGAAVGTAYPQGISGGWFLTRVGRPSIANWDMHGDYLRLVLINATIPRILSRCP